MGPSDQVPGPHGIRSARSGDECQGKQRGVIPRVVAPVCPLVQEGIVPTPTDALRTFFSSGMDALLMGSFLVEK